MITRMLCSVLWKSVLYIKFIWVYTQAMKQEKIYTQGQLKLAHINFATLNSHVIVI